MSIFLSTAFQIVLFHVIQAETRSQHFPGNIATSVETDFVHFENIKRLVSVYGLIYLVFILLLIVLARAGLCRIFPLTKIVMLAASRIL
ncbi:hypothetical protein [Varibaculum cambriense]|uniref:hypothetical protein n=1 Tax=Varibaculum cambriense TaxID=184870 RepID=UPI00292D8564|nr:hypothetical protein [Varibaculum cambriense]